MKANELIVKKEEELTDSQFKFVLVHNNILNAGSMITNSVISLAKNLKIMRDEKLYLEAECKSFEEYAEEICGLKRTQAYAYIQTIEKLGEEFVRSNGQIGIAKLSLLAALPEGEKEKIVETVNVESTSVKELKEEIKKLKQELEEKDEKITEIDMNELEVTNLKAEIDKLTTQLKVLENKPPEIQVQEDTQSKEKVKELQSKLKESQEKLKAKNEELEKVKEEGKLSIEEASNLKKQINLNTDKTMIEFKIKFEALQAQITDITSMIGKLPEERIEGCRAALKKVVEVLC